MSPFLLRVWLLLFIGFCNTAFAAVGDQPIGYAHEEPLLLGSTFPDGITEAELGELSLTDSKLRIAYAALMRAPFSVIVANAEPRELMAVLYDLKRRGETATPLLIDMMKKNHNTDLEYSIVLAVHEIGTFRMDPYLEYLRDMVKSRADEINATANEVTAKIFLERGTSEDVQMMQELARKRPFLAPSLERAFEFQRWKHPDQSKAKETSSTPKSLADTLQAPTKAPEAKPTSPTPYEEPTSSTPWSTIVLLMVAATGLLWLLAKNRKWGGLL